MFKKMTKFSNVWGASEVGPWGSEEMDDLLDIYSSQNPTIEFIKEVRHAFVGCEIHDMGTGKSRAVGYVV